MAVFLTDVILIKINVYFHFSGFFGKLLFAPLYHLGSFIHISASLLSHNY